MENVNAKNIPEGWKETKTGLFGTNFISKVRSKIPKAKKAKPV